MALGGQTEKPAQRPKTCLVQPSASAREDAKQDSSGAKDGTLSYARYHRRSHHKTDVLMPGVNGGMTQDFERRVAATRNLECQVALERRKMLMFHIARSQSEKNDPQYKVKFLAAYSIEYSVLKLIMESPLLPGLLGSVSVLVYIFLFLYNKNKLE
jgi:hypothetical protein